MVEVLCLILLATQVHAADPSNSSGVVKQEAISLRDEAVEVATTPFDTDGYGLWGTIAVGGAVGLTYLFDEDIREKVQANRSGTLDTAADIGSVVGNPLLHLGIAGAIYGGGILADSPALRETGAMLGEAALLADATSFVLKQAIGRGRPFAANDKGSFRPFQFKSDYDSLPSMHVASSFAMASVLSSTTENLGYKLLYYTSATFVGFSRIYEDKHWASDIVLGAAVGELCGRIVTKYHDSHHKLAIVPVYDGSSASVGLVWKW
ncbi:MAG: phosphatase PAP2 family protein [Geobacter sp.]|nr:phosphatase PAP2 family protein [Geobacter sp.]